MWTIIFVVWALAIYNFRARVIRHITKHHKWKMLRLHVLIIGMLSTAIIFAFPHLIEYLWLWSKNLQWNIWFITILQYIAYLVITGWLTYIWYLHTFFTKHYMTRLIVFVVLFGLMASAWIVLDVAEFIIYFSIVAFWEEYIKYAFGYSLYEKLQIHYTDLLLFCLISWFAFAFIENIAYARYQISPDSSAWFLDQSQAGFKVLTTRWLINVALHGVFTGIIGMFTLNPTKWHTSVLKIIFWIATWSVLHRVFNSLMSQKLTIILPVFLLGSYIFITYLMFKSDTLYNQKD